MPLALLLALTLAAGFTVPPAGPPAGAGDERAEPAEVPTGRAREARLALAALGAVLAALGALAFVRGRRIAVPLEKRVLANTLRAADHDGRQPLRGKAP